MMARFHQESVVMPEPAHPGLARVCEEAKGTVAVKMEAKQRERIGREVRWKVFMRSLLRCYARWRRCGQQGANAQGNDGVAAISSFSCIWRCEVLWSMNPVQKRR